MKSSDTYGTCDCCGIALSSSYRSLDRNIEQYSYGGLAEDGATSTSATCNIVASHSLMQLCSKDCAFIASTSEMSARDLKYLYPSSGPVEPCAKCGHPVDLSQHHVTYALTKGTEVRKPWITEFHTKDSRDLAVLCKECDGEGLEAAVARDVQNEQTKRKDQSHNEREMNP